MKKRALILFLTVLFLFACFASPAAAWNQRSSAPSTGNSYYYSNNNPFYATVYNGQRALVGECTWYSWGRAYEVLGKKPNLSTSHARDWYGKTSDGFSRGKQPAAGSVICWGDGNHVGHVAFVEAVHANGSITISEFNWNTRHGFDTRTLTAAQTKSQVTLEYHCLSDGTYKISATPLQGYIYIASKSYDVALYNNYSGKNYLLGSDFSSGKLNWIASRDTSVTTAAVDQTVKHSSSPSLKVVNTKAGAGAKDITFGTSVQSRANNGFVSESKDMTLSF